MISRAVLLICLLGGLVFPGSAFGQAPEWIWHGNAKSAAAGETRYFRKQFHVPFEAQQAVLTATGDDTITVYLNGTEVASSRYWGDPATVDVTKHVREGTNVLAAVGSNGAPGLAAILIRLEVRSPNMFGLYFGTDATWLSSAEAGTNWQHPATPVTGWSRAVSLGRNGVAPWGDVLKSPQATPAESLTVLPGFKAELLRSAQKDEGSWIAMCVDGKGRLILSPEKNEVPLLRVTLTESGAFQKIERLNSPLRAAMGLCWAYDSLYVNGRGPAGVGLYRVIDKNQNDQLDPGEEKLLKHFEGDNEHGYHAVAPGPDGAIYVMNGNHTKVPPGLRASSPYTNYAEDLLLPRQWDANGHAKGVMAPGGYILKTDPDGREWSLICGGFRNTYDFDFSPEGEIFTFDSDMEWDIGAPWYRPTRILHCVSGGEYGWRSGTGKWPVYYPDSLPAVVDIGLSSPTGTRFGTTSHFPEKYRRAFYAADWAYGKIFAVHLEPSGASYTGTFETFVSGKPLAVSGMAFGADGAMYFVIGGWKIQSGLYRISYVGEGGGSALLAARKVTPAEQLRRQLESFHGKKSAEAIKFSWPHLGSQDRWLRFAARVAVESQPVGEWRERALSETNLNATLTALLGLARCGATNDQPAIIKRCLSALGAKLPEAETLDALRVLQLACIRLGKPDASIRGELVSGLSRLYPSDRQNLNRELCQLLVYLGAPDVLSKTLALMSAATTQEEQMHYAFVLRNVKQGWTREQRHAYFGWYQMAMADYRGGSSFRPFLVNMRTDALTHLTPVEKEEIAGLLHDRPPTAWQPRPRQIVKEWTFEELEPAVAQPTSTWSFSRGKHAYIDSQCALCHRIGNDGGAVGPDLTGVSGRFGRRDLLENIVSPSKIISDRYQSYTITTRDGDEFTGCITDETDEKLVVIVNPLSDQRQTVLKKDIATREVSKTSAMPEGLLNVLEKEEIADLVRFLESDGKGQ